MQKSLKDMMKDAYLEGKKRSNDLSFTDWYNNYISQVRFKDRKFTDSQIRTFRADCKEMHISKACEKNNINYNTGWAIKEYKTYKDVE